MQQKLSSIPPQNFFRRHRQDAHFNLAIMKQKTRALKYSAEDHYSAAEDCMVVEVCASSPRFIAIVKLIAIKKVRNYGKVV